MTILFTGGGTMGPVTPLLAVLRRMQALNPDVKVAWAGTPDGPERDVIKKEGIPYYEIPVAKFPRFLTIRIGTFPFDYWKARRASRKVLDDVKPSLVVSAGAFSSVPVMHEAHRRGIACATHQLDVKPGLSNKIISRWCDMITTSFDYERGPFGRKSERIATPCRFAGKNLPSREEAIASFALDPSRSVIFVVGGGTGATALNEAIWDELKKYLNKTQIIHLTGKGKNQKKSQKGYLVAEFFDEQRILSAYVAADLVVSRAGMGGIIDAVCLKKPAILVPIPNTHQEKNAERMPFPIVPQGAGFAERLRSMIEKLLKDEKERTRLSTEGSKALTIDDGTAITKRWLGLLGFKY